MAHRPSHSLQDLKKHFTHIGLSGFRTSKHGKVRQGHFTFSDVYTDVVLGTINTMTKDLKAKLNTKLQKDPYIKEEQVHPILNNWTPKPSPHGKDTWTLVAKIIEHIVNSYLETENQPSFQFPDTNNHIRSQAVREFLRHAFIIYHLNDFEVYSKNFNDQANSIARELFALPYIKEQFLKFSKVNVAENKNSRANSSDNFPDMQQTQKSLSTHRRLVTNYPLVVHALMYSRK